MCVCVCVCVCEWVSACVCVVSGGGCTWIQVALTGVKRLRKHAVLWGSRV